MTQDLKHCDKCNTYFNNDEHPCLEQLREIEFFPAPQADIFDDD